MTLTSCSASAATESARDLFVAEVEDALGDGVRAARQDLFTREGLQECSGGSRTIEVMGHGAASLTQGEQRALASFYAGRLPAGQLHAALTRARADALAAAAAREAPPEVALPVAEAPVQAVPAPALRAA